jgi:hypothetical protein
MIAFVLENSLLLLPVGALYLGGRRAKRKNRCVRCA